MIRKLLGLVTLGGAFVVVACGDDPPADKYPTTDSFCSAKAVEECKAAAALCSVTEETCKARRTQACTSAAGTAVSQGRVYRPANAEACLSKTTSVYADRVIDATKEEDFTETCARVFAGSKKKSEACVNAYDCEGTLACDVQKGFCADKADKKLDEACNNPGDICGDGLYCEAGAVKFCRNRKKLGDACNADQPCLEDLRCTTSCVAKLRSGEPCDTSDQCSTRLCNADKKCGARQFPTETGTCADFGG